VLTYLHVREDDLTLYGFARPIERELFCMLLGVSQVGPAVAMNVLSSCPPESFKRYIMDEDSKAIAALVKGIGPKTARRLIVELQSRMKDLAVQAAEGEPENQVVRDTVDALVQLGTSRAAAEKSVRAALKRLGPDVDHQTLLSAAVNG
jgi:Holliday junction DNA helicase RuvA